MRYSENPQMLLTLISFLTVASLLLAGCSSPNPQLVEFSRQAYAKKNWKGPLPPREFVSDGCSCFPDSEWVECCVTHDVIYWMGGTREERKQADSELQTCVSKKGHPVIGTIMYYGVRVGGVYWLPTSYRWGFGWDYPKSGPPGKQY